MEESARAEVWFLDNPGEPGAWGLQAGKKRKEYAQIVNAKKIEKIYLMLCE